MAKLTYTQVSEILKYDPDTGKLFWKERRAHLFEGDDAFAERNCASWNARFAGKEAFTAKNAKGYHQGGIFYNVYRAHRIIWLLHTGEWPEGEIDHINGVRSDNRISNLRHVTSGENRKNQKKSSRNTSGVVGVTRSKALNKWSAKIIIGGVHKHLGLFDDLSDAAQARKAAEATYGFHKNHGR